MGPERNGGVKIKVIDCRTALFLAAACLFALPVFGSEEPANSKPEVFKQESFLANLSPGIATQTLRVSPNGQRIAYMAKLEDGTETVFVNNDRSPKYAGIVKDSLSFSPDSERVGYGALRDGNKVVVVDGKEYPAFNGSAEGMPLWSSDSKHFAFFAMTDGGRLLAVVDGKPGREWDLIIKDSFVFSPDSSRFAFIAKDGDFGRVVVDGEAGPRNRNVAGFSFSPDSRHFAYIAMFELSMSIIVDGIEMASAPAFIKDSLRFDGARQLHAVSLKGGSLTALRIDLIKLPETTNSSKTSDPTPQAHTK